MPETTDRSPAAPPDWSYDSLFERAAWRVLRRNEMAVALIPAEIEHLRRVDPGFTLPTVEELERDPELRGSR